MLRLDAEELLHHGCMGRSAQLQLKPFTNNSLRLTKPNQDFTHYQAKVVNPSSLIGPERCQTSFLGALNRSVMAF